MKTAWLGLSLSTKLSLIFTILMFVSLPVTVLSVNLVRDSRTRAAGFGGPDPDPTFTLERDPTYYLTYCVAVNDKNNSTYCKQRINIGSSGTYDISYPAAGLTYYWFVDVLGLKTTGDVAVISGTYSEIYNQSFHVPDNCPRVPVVGSKESTQCSEPAHVSGWKNNQYTMQATLHGTITNACNGAVASCVSNVTTANLDQKTVQFVDFKPGTRYDVYTYIKGNILFDIKPDLSVPEAGIDSYPKIVSPRSYDINIATDLAFQWEKVAGATYYSVLLSNNSDLSKGVWYNKLQAVDDRCSSNICYLKINTSGWASQNFPAVPTHLEQGTKYYWLVWACNVTSCPQSGLSPQYSFTTSGTAPTSSNPNPVSTTISAPTLLGPKDAAANQIASVQTLFSWTRVSGAQRYGLWISTNEDFSKGFWAASINDNNSGICLDSAAKTCYVNYNNVSWSSVPASFDKFPGLQKGQKYYWLVWACSTNDLCPNEGVSQKFSFTTEGYKDPTQVAQPSSQPDQLTTSAISCSSTDPAYISAFTFNWSSDNATKEYAVDVSENPAFENGYANKAQPVSLGRSIKNGPTRDPADALKDYRWANRNGASIVDNEVLKFKLGKTYYWRVWASNGGDTWTYDKQSSAGAPASFKVDNCSTTPRDGKVLPITAKPNLIAPKPAGGDLPTVDQDGRPAFYWSPVTNATTYVISVTDNKNNLNPLGPRWSSYVSAFDCTAACHRNWADSGNWASFAGASGFPTVLKPGLVYYWVVYACNAEGCPVAGQSNISSIAIKGDSVKEIPPTSLQPVGSVANGSVKFTWKAAQSSEKIVDYVLLLKKGNGDLLGGVYEGDFWYKGRISCSTDCSADLGPIWTAFDHKFHLIQDFPSPPNPLSAGDWYWAVLACKNNDGCPFGGNVLASDVAHFSISADRQAQAAKITNEPIQGECNKDGTRDITFNWSPSKDSTASAQFVDISKYDNNFIDGTYIGSVQLNPGQQTYQWKGIESGQPHFWRVNTKVWNSFYPSNTGNFVVKDCEQLQASSVNGQSQAQSSGTQGTAQKNSLGIEIGLPFNYDALAAYIDSIAINDKVPSTSLNLATLMRSVMWKESRGMDCKWNVDWKGGVATQSTIGVFQFTPDLWQGQDRVGVNSKEALNYVDSGSIAISGKTGKKNSGCWGVPGYDDDLSQTQGQEFWENMFPGTNDDAGVWNPYAQIRAAKAYMLGGFVDRWSTAK